MSPVVLATLARYVPRWLDLLGEAIEATDAEGGPASHTIGAQIALAHENAVRHVLVSITSPVAVA